MIYEDDMVSRDIETGLEFERKCMVDNGDREEEADKECPLKEEYNQSHRASIIS